MALKARTVILVIVYIVAVLSIAAGIPKIMQMPQELGFLSSIGLTGATVSILGAVQLTGGALLLMPRFRLIGAIMAACSLLVSSIAIIASGDFIFGAISLLPFFASMIIVYVELKETK